METNEFKPDDDFLAFLFEGADTAREVERKKSVYERMVEKDVQRNLAAYADELKEADDADYTRDVEVPSRKGGSVWYVRLTAERHEALKDILSSILANKHEWKRELALKSGLYGERIGKPSTFLHLVEGMNERMNEPHPNVKGRMGLDCSRAQMDALDTLLIRLCGNAFDRDYKPELRE